MLSVLPRPLEWCLTPEDEAVWAAAHQQNAIQVAFMLVFVGASKQRSKRYLAWLDEKLIVPLQKNHPENWEAALDFLKSYMPQLMEIDDGQDAQ